MNRLEHLQLLATYNRWMNEKLYCAAGSLPADALTADRQAFFGSILGTLNHLLVADLIWLRRFADHPASHEIRAVLDIPAPRALDEVLLADFVELEQQRVWLDERICGWIASLREEDLDTTLAYSSMKGVPARKNLHSLLAHLFNHQTHHRGQVTALLAQAGVDYGTTDLLLLVSDD